MVDAAEDKWEFPQVPVRISPGQVHVWRTRLDGIGASDDALWEMLSEEEQERAARFHFQQHRYRFLRSHAICRMILANYTGIHPKEIQIGASQKGKPYLLHSRLPMVEFNLSHSGDLLALGISPDGRIGVDVELISEKVEWRQVAGNYFNATELHAIEKQPEPQEQVAWFYRIWTLKEAYLKALGDGLAGGLEQVEVQTDPQRPPGFVALPGEIDEKNRWQVFTFLPAAGACGAVVVETDQPALKLMRYTWADRFGPIP